MALIKMLWRQLNRDESWVFDSRYYVVFVELNSFSTWVTIFIFGINQSNKSYNRNKVFKNIHWITQRLSIQPTSALLMNLVVLTYFQFPDSYHGKKIWKYFLVYLFIIYFCTQIYIIYFHYFSGLHLGSILASVSPAVVVPTVNALSARGLGLERQIALLVANAGGLDTAFTEGMFGVINSAIFYQSAPVYRIVKVIIIHSVSLLVKALSFNAL